MKREVEYQARFTTGVCICTTNFQELLQWAREDSTIWKLSWFKNGKDYRFHRMFAQDKDGWTVTTRKKLESFPNYQHCCGIQDIWVHQDIFSEHVPSYLSYNNDPYIILEILKENKAFLDEVMYNRIQKWAMEYQIPWDFFHDPVISAKLRSLNSNSFNMITILEKYFDETQYTRKDYETLAGLDMIHGVYLLDDLSQVNFSC